MFYLSPRNSVLSRGIYWMSWWSAKHQNLPYHQKLLSGQTYSNPRRIPETLAGYVQPPGQTCPPPSSFSGFQRPNLNTSGPQPGHARHSSLSQVNQAYPAPMPGSRSISQTCLAPNPDMSDLTWFLNDQVPRLDISGPLASFQRGHINYKRFIIMLKQSLSSPRQLTKKNSTV
jgi:hypothetical protein